MQYDQIEGQGYGGLKVVKMADFWVYLFCRYARNQKADGELWYFSTIAKF